MSNRRLEHNSSTEPDSRYFPRWEVDEPVVCQLDGENGVSEGKTKDISCAGARIVGDWHIAPHQKVKLTVQLSKSARIKLNAHILWVKSMGGLREMGVTFYDTSDEVQDQILQHAFNLDKEKVTKQWFKGWEGS